MQKLYNAAEIDDSANVIISTIHAATDIRYDNTYVIMHDKGNEDNINIMRVAL